MNQITKGFETTTLSHTPSNIINKAKDGDSLCPYCRRHTFGISSTKVEYLTLSTNSVKTYKTYHCREDGHKWKVLVSEEVRIANRGIIVASIIIASMLLALYFNILSIFIILKQ